MGASADGPIFIVDDTLTVREALQELLELEGHSVVTAEDGDQALEQLRSGLAPQLVLLDLMMPKKDGFHFHRELLADPALANIPVVIYSSIHNVHYAALEMSVTGWFQQPVHLDVLRELIDKYRYR